MSKHLEAKSLEPESCQECDRKKENYMNEMTCFFCLYQQECRRSEAKTTWIYVLVTMVIVGLLLDFRLMLTPRGALGVAH